MSSSAHSRANSGPSPLLDIPLELRHHIFSHVAAARDIKPRYTLRYWFEKADIHEQIADHLKNDPDANVTYAAGYNSRYDDDEEEEPEVQDDAAVDDNAENEDDEGQDEDEDDGNQEQNEDGQDEDEQDGHDVDAADEDEDNIDNEDEDISGQQDATADGATAAANIAQDGTTFTDTILTTNLNQRVTEDTETEYNPLDHDVQNAINAANIAMAEAADAQDGSENAVEDPEAAQAVHDANMADAGGNYTTVGNGLAAGADTAAGENVVAATASPEPPEPKIIVVKPNSKWRHVSKFMRLTQCPPLANLFLISKQLNIEAKQWFYDVATLKIDATASFLHFTFFELALNKLAEAPFSPMENIKNAEITFVWDTTWIRSESGGFAGAVFPVFLKDRVDFILEILLRAPELKKVKIHWYDSAQDDGAMQLRADTLEPFILNLKAAVDTEDHYIAPDAKPRAKSRAGKQRLEFKAIIDNGCETF
ncbi:uncharacterized protein N0V89_000461 [Didymosphaeria variabile]|uniref:Uncharacterized protein n=1 Tax=Didymosphaeria variabile TaxID=1932322 RepID=A0A9W8XUC7_9PLEO|nr:uncharacterized protein N0V89_000461 [Didymosphaeria variabile]KAJ4359904.1 hypothetical protein N0V89_000461 [Didymosphaeria variabile]